ncbi:pickpocket protein 28-like isoform X2 [Sitodiplosis mosellana]|uniref:pickpocket protein 28-like isoform X2 n=1 Tax=Sitodiplosis mosellana TaxID=263140 RepID=UPI002444612A|nr:pickpocket protein 28-like isoform X2 [Sitodiplosis mosellana]
MHCNCSEACMSIDYSGKFDQMKRTFGQNGTNNLIQTRLTIFFEDDYIRTNIAVETYTIGDFLSICGGLLGLFLGVSAISVIELIYYATLRLFWTIRYSRTENTEKPSKQTSHDDQIDQNTKNREVKWIILFVRRMQTWFMIFCANSNIHGVRYISKRRLHWSERLWWLVFVGVSVCLCGLMIRGVWIQKLEDPVKLDMAKDGNDRIIPFPTVTICPETKTVRSKLDVTRAVKTSANLSAIEITRINALAHICPRLSDSIEYTDNLTTDAIYDTIQDIAPRMIQSEMRCVWQVQWKKCSKLFVPTLTEEGLCFAFNALNVHDIYTDDFTFRLAPEMMNMNNNDLNVSGWTLDSGYANESAGDNYPFQSAQLEEVNRLILTVASFRSDMDYQCRGIDQGHKLFLTTPGETLTPSRKYVRLPILTLNMVEIIPSVITATEVVRDFEPHQRKCFYSFDRPLRFFKIYTKINCEEECLANFTRIECGCVKFSSPRDKHTKICGGASVKCYKLAKRKLFTSSNGKAFYDKCNCLPSCTYVGYDAVISRTDIDLETLKQISKRFSEEFCLTTSILRFKSLRSLNVKSMNRKELYTFTTDFLAVCGGLLGLFLGVSVLSIFELIYYLTLRLFWFNRRVARAENVVVPFNHEAVIELAA